MWEVRWSPALGCTIPSLTFLNISCEIMIIEVYVKPGSKKEEVIEEEGKIILKIKERAEKGKANKRAIEVLAEHFNKNKADIKIIKGITSRKKIVEVR